MYGRYGSDGAHINNYEKMGLSLHERQEIIDPIFVPQSFQLNGSKKHHSRYSTPRTQIPQDKWQEVSSRKANGETLRTLAAAYGVSYEAIRQVLKREDSL